MEHWNSRFLSWMLTIASRGLMLRDHLLGVTHRLRAHDAREECFIASGKRKLACVYVPGVERGPAVLLCHGIGETVQHWSAVQALFHDQGVGSLIFNYSGYGRSTGQVRATLRVFFGFCLDRKWATENVARRIKSPRNIKPNDVVPFTALEVGAILKACSGVGRAAYERARTKAMVLTHVIRLSASAMLQCLRVTGLAGTETAGEFSSVQKRTASQSFCRCPRI